VHVREGAREALDELDEGVAPFAASGLCRMYSHPPNRRTASRGFFSLNATVE
jgi:hypothetical protein